MTRLGGSLPLLAARCLHFNLQSCVRYASTCRVVVVTARGIELIVWSMRAPIPQGMEQHLEQNRSEDRVAAYYPAEPRPMFRELTCRTLIQIAPGVKPNDRPGGMPA